MLPQEADSGMNRALQVEWITSERLCLLRSLPARARAEPRLHSSTMFVDPLDLLRGLEPRDPVAAKRSDPKFLADLHCNSTGAECVGVGLPDQFLNFESIR